MTEEQNMHSEPMQYRNSSFSARSQEWQERRMAKHAAREARQAARAQRPHRDWTFEVKAGEKIYTFTWRWHQAEPQLKVIEEAKTKDLETENGPGTPGVSQ